MKANVFGDLGKETLLYLFILQIPIGFDVLKNPCHMRLTVPNSYSSNIDTYF